MRAVFGHAIKRSRKTATEPIGVSFKAPNDISSKPDPRLVALVRILARQAARDFYSRRMGRPGKGGPPPLFDAKDDRIARQRSVRPSISRNPPP